MTEYITQEKAAELSRECSIDWHKGFSFDDTGNRYADLCNAAIQHYLEHHAIPQEPSLLYTFCKKEINRAFMLELEILELKRKINDLTKQR